MMQDKFFNWLPTEIRDQALQSVKGQTAVSFPAAYFFKCPKSQHLAWKTLSPMTKDGLVVKTAPNFLIQGLIKTLDKYQVDYEVIQL